MTGSSSSGAERCDNCPPVGETFYEGKVWTCFVCGTKWKGNGLDHDGPLIERCTDTGTDHSSGTEVVDR